MPRTFPHGLDCEAFLTSALAQSALATTDPADREHVTPWMRRAPHLKRANLSSGDPSLASHRWTLDYPEDLAFFRALFAALPPGSPARLADVLACLEQHPEIVAINAARRQMQSSQ